VNLPSPPLLLVTDRTQARLPLDEVVARACAGGCRWASLREKDLPADARVALAGKLKPIAQRYGVRLTLHGDAQLARTAGLGGVHLSAHGDAAAARALLGPQALVGISIHGATEAAVLDPAIVDYAIAGPAFLTASKPGYGPTLGLDGLAAICRAARVPIVPIGGIEPNNVSAVMAAGAAGIAVMGSIMRADDPRRATENLLAALAPVAISICTMQDFNQILAALPEFWDGRDTRHLHHPFLIHEFGDTAFVIREEGRVVAYLFGFFSQTHPVGFVHAIAVRASARRRGLAQRLYGHFIKCARRRGCTHVKATTNPANAGSIAFHRSLGMQLLGEANADGVPVIRDYAGRDAARVVFWKPIERVDPPG
jgi:thiamine-phosphate pyrophosphorylase